VSFVRPGSRRRVPLALRLSSVSFVSLSVATVFFSFALLPLAFLGIEVGPVLAVFDVPFRLELKTLLSFLVRLGASLHLFGRWGRRRIEYTGQHSDPCLSQLGAGVEKFADERRETRR
jgi:hypothetical protein